MGAVSIQPIEQWAANRAQKVPFSILSNSVIGVDASYYLGLRLNDPEIEPLLHALGGFPDSLHDLIEKDLKALEEHAIKVVFVFDGLDFVNKRQQTGTLSAATIRALEDAWQTYYRGDGDKTRSDFSRASKHDGVPQPVHEFTELDYPVETLYRYAQKVLSDLKVEYMVAPYSAAAQLSYLLHSRHQFIDTVLGSADCFLFNVDRIFTALHAKGGTFDCLYKNDCQQRLDRASDELFRDCQLLLGSPYLPMFPPLARISPSKPSLRDSLGLLLNASRSVAQLCHQYRDDPQVQALQYKDRYMKAIMTIKHHVVLETNGSVAPMDFDHAPGDVHEFVGQKLPDELFYYISKGLMGPRVPNWLTSAEIILTLPGSVEDKTTYRQLVVEKLNGIRTQSLKLLADSLNRYYQSRVINLKVWFERDTSDLAITIRNLPSAREKMGTWKVKENKDWPDAIRKPPSQQSLLELVRFFKDDTQSAKTISKYEPDAPPCLETPKEICFNVFWRFLHMREYLDDKHQLTNWGRVLEAALAALDPDDKAEELAVIAVELMRLNVLNGNELAGGTPEKDKMMTNLIVRVACLGRLRHVKSKGFSGPLDRQLLSFAEMISSVRSSLRDLIETVFVCMFLNGDAVRERTDWAELSQSLPFISDNGCGLGIATRTYLDAVVGAELEGKDVKEVKRQTKRQQLPYQWFSHTINYEKSVELAFRLWDAVYAGSQAAGKDFKEAKLFTEANEWLVSKR